MECPYFVGQRVTPTGLVTNRVAIGVGMRAGGIYTIRSIQIQLAVFKGNRAEHVTLLSKELPDRHDGIGWHWTQFRPVTDISSLQELLKTPAPTPSRTLEPAT